jgi:putative DNA methylase
MADDLRLIEDYLPIQAISAEASREKSVRKGHISTLHLWWARRPLVACRAAVYGALVPADRWVKEINVKNGQGKDLEKFKNGTKRGLNRKHAKEFVTKLCRYPKTDPKAPADIKLKNETEAAIVEAQKHILEAHADRLTVELAEAKKTGKPPSWMAEFKFEGERVTYDDIIAGRAPRPRVLDMFAGGGAIPLEALRLGCEAYALDLNPVAHIIQLCTLVYPQKYGRPDASARGMTGPKDAKGETTWGGLADEVRHWGDWVVDIVRREIGDLYPLIPDPTYKKPSKKAAKASAQVGASGKQVTMHREIDEDEEAIATVAVPPGFLMPVAYLWTRAVRCKNPACGATVPLVKQTWLCKKDNRYVALEVAAPAKAKRVIFKVVESDSEAGLGFDPTAFSKGGNATCPFCGTVADSDYVKGEGISSRIGQQFMAVACTHPTRSGKVYLDERHLPPGFAPDAAAFDDRTSSLVKTHSIEPLDETIEINPRSMDIDRAGFTRWADIFTGRQQLAMMACVAAMKACQKEVLSKGYDAACSKALLTMIGTAIGKFADFCSTLCMFNYTGGRGVKNSFPQQSLPMVWDFAETNPFNPDGASIIAAFQSMVAVTEMLAGSGAPATVVRGSALSLPWHDRSLDAVITDPPYYDNVSYSNLSDFFYVWLRRCLGGLYPEHYANIATPKKAEAIAASYRHGGNRRAANTKYEEMMEQAFREAARVLVPSGEMVVVYAHKTTLGWSTLVDALRRAGFCVVEAWPLDTERKGRVIALDTAALASSIFLIARKREASAGVGNYEDDVQPDLQQIVRERVETLWDMGIAGADLVIACVGAGLRAFTKYEKVEYANGEEVPAEKFLAEVEGVVLDTMLGKLSGIVGGNVAAVDSASRFYVLWRFVYKAAEMDAGEAIVFAMGTHVELDGGSGLSAGNDALIEKKKAKYRARDFTERGDQEKLGLPGEDGEPAPLIDALHRVLWLMENSPRKLNEFLEEARLDRERMRVLAQALAGAALSGKSDEEAAKLVSTTPAEQSALGKLLANWRNLIEAGPVAAVVGQRAVKEPDQMTIDYRKPR